MFGCFRLLLRGQKSLIGGLPEDGPLFVLPRAVGLALLSSAGNLTDEFILCSLVTLAFSEFIVERIILHTHAHIGMHARQREIMRSFSYSYLVQYCAVTVNIHGYFSVHIAFAMQLIADISFAFNIGVTEPFIDIYKRLRVVTH